MHFIVIFRNAEAFILFLVFLVTSAASFLLTLANSILEFLIVTSVFYPNMRNLLASLKHPSPF